MSKDFNILVIGNGFDLAHGLPTTYGDFLRFCEYIPNYDVSYINNDKLSFEFHDFPLSSFNRRLYTMSDEEFDTIKRLLSEYKKDNIWHKYFLALYKDKLSGENWIDFESEISAVIKFLDKEENHLNDDLLVYLSNFKKEQEKNENLKLEDRKTIILTDLLLEYIDVIKEHSMESFNLNLRITRNILFEELENLMIALNYYLTEFIEKLDIWKTPKELKELYPDMIFSFNYTHTYTKVFENAKKEKVFHIHGECTDEAFEKNNIVLGIDEYFEDDRKNSNTDYVTFKKYVQRILKNTSPTIYKIKDILKKRAAMFNSEKTHIYFYGHSLDITDKDILRALLKHKNIRTTIFCRHEADKGEYIAKLIKILNQKKVIERFELGLIEFVVLENNNQFDPHRK